MHDRCMGAVLCSCAGATGVSLGGVTRLPELRADALLVAAAVPRVRSALGRRVHMLSQAAASRDAPSSLAMVVLGGLSGLQYGSASRCHLPGARSTCCLRLLKAHAPLLVKLFMPSAWPRRTRTARPAILRVASQRTLHGTDPWPTQSGLNPTGTSGSLPHRIPTRVGIKDQRQVGMWGLRRGRAMVTDLPKGTLPRSILG